MSRPESAAVEVGPGDPEALRHEHGAPGSPPAAVPAAVIVGVGHRDRRDDAAGLLVAEELGRRHPQLRVTLREGDLAVLPMCWERGDDVVIVDAVAWTGDDAAYRVVPVDADDVTARTLVSSHGFGVVDALRLAKVVGLEPASLRIYGVRARRFGVGPPPDALVAAVPQLADQLVELLAT